MSRRRWSPPTRPDARRAGRYRRSSVVRRPRRPVPKPAAVSASRGVSGCRLLGLADRRVRCGARGIRSPAALRRRRAVSQLGEDLTRGVVVVRRLGCPHRVESALDLDPVHDPDHLPLMVQRRHRDLPSAVEGPSRFAAGTSTSSRNDLAERFVGDRRHADGFDRHTGGFQIEDQARDAAVFGCVRIGAGIQRAPSRLVCLGGPDLPAVDPEHVAVALRRGCAGRRNPIRPRARTCPAPTTRRRAAAEPADGRSARRCRTGGSPGAATPGPAMLGSLGADRIAASSRTSIASARPNDRPPCSRGQVGCSHPASNAARW